MSISSDISVVSDPDEYLRWFECAETEEELNAIMLSPNRRHALEQVPENLDRLHKDSFDDIEKLCSQTYGSTELPQSSGLVFKRSTSFSTDMAASSVLRKALELWELRVAGYRTSGAALWEMLKDGCPELEWADDSSARRMVRAMLGDEKKAVDMLVQAIEMRVRDRKLFTTMRCKVNADIRIIGRDLKDQPTVYMCARSQRVPLCDIRDQLVLAFEAACRMTSPEGRVVFVADMYGLSPRLNMDLSALKDVSDTLGTIFAERIGLILVVDFSRAAQAAWWLLKPLLSETTQKKFAFVRGAEALEMCRSSYDKAVFDRIKSSMDINRDPNRTPEELQLHARRTSVCEAPLGCALMGEE